MNPPEGYVKVTKEDFYKVMNPRNVHPYPSREYTEWRQVDSQRMVGFETSGYANPEKETAGLSDWYVRPDLAPA
jgi:hypothetical protein